MSETFTVTATDGAARAGILCTAHGEVPTPAFMPVGTQATVKGLTPDQLIATGTRMLLANTFHLALRPGEAVVAAAGGLHGFMGWDGPILTDSGGFQVMSLASMRKLSEEGVLFRSHIDGSRHLLTPERAVSLQLGDFGVDVAMVLDECTPHPATKEEAALSMARTHRWAERSVSARAAQGVDGKGALFGIVQGGMHEDLRAESAAAVSSMLRPAK